MKRSIKFVVDGIRCGVKFEIDPKLNPGRPHISLSGDFDGAGGQIDRSLLEAGSAYPEIITLCDLWDAHHSKKPTKKAEKAINAALDALAGMRFGHAPDVDDAPDVSSSDDVIDSRDVIKRIEIYRDALLDAGVDPDTATVENFDPDEFGENGAEVAGWLAEFHALTDLEKEVNCSDWKYGTTLINADYFQTFAEDEAESLGLIDSASRWPSTHIDWEAAAAELMHDYSSVTFKGTTFYTRD